MTGFDSKREAAADKLHWSDCAVHNGPAYPAGPCDCGAAQEPVAWITPDGEGFRIRFSAPTNDVPLGWDALYTTPPLPAQPAQDPEMLTIVYQSGYHDGKQAALAGREWNFCERCGKRTADLTIIHTCTPPQGDA